MEERLKKNPQMGAQYLTGFTTARGALPIMIGEEVIGAAGVSGAPGGDKDEACVKAGIEKCMSSEHFGQLAWQFKRMSGSSGLKVQAVIAC